MKVLSGTPDGFDFDFIFLLFQKYKRATD